MSKPLKFLILFAFGLTTMSSCLTTNQSYDRLMPGMWRGELFLDENNPLSRNISKVGNDQDISFKNAFTEGVLPFNFEVTYDDKDSMTIDLINGDERVRAEEILYGWDRRIAKDTVRINFIAFDTYIHADVEDGIMTGAWYNPRKNWRIPFRGIAGKAHRFTLLKDAPRSDISGKWLTVFKSGEDVDTVIGQFTARSNHLTGTFASPTGDYGFLEGTVQGDHIFMSNFDGGHAYLVSGKIMDDTHLEGTFMSGKTGRATWTAVRDDNARLPDAGSLVSARSGNEVSFSFPDHEGKLVSLKDPQFAGKAKVITLMGTWCPNCKDESRFLVDYLRAHPNKDLAVIALAFEAYDDTSKVRSLLTNYKRVMQLPYPVLWAGKAGKDAGSKVPFISGIKAYPTMIFLDKNDRIVSIHTGFSGPATKEYAGFKQEFAHRIEQLTRS